VPCVDPTDARKATIRPTRAARLVDASIDPTETRYGRMLNKNQTTANQWVGALLTGRGDWTATELLLAGVQGWEAVVRRRMTGEMPAK
jgi:hypothetical protein